MSNHRSALLEYITSNAWAMELGVMNRCLDVLGRHFDGVKLSTDEISVIVATRDAKALDDDGRIDDHRAYSVQDGVGVISIAGIIAKHAYMVNGSSQPRGTAAQAVIAELEAALDDKAVNGILLLVDSPGGSVYGTADMADAIFAARSRKPVVAYIQDMGASAAYYAASQAELVLCNASAAVGSIGVYCVIVDSSRKAEKEGLKFNVVKAGSAKAVAVAGTAFGDDQRAIIQGEIDAYYRLFVEAVARGRGVDAQAVLGVADGRVHIGQAAVDVGLVDGICTYRDALETVRQIAAGKHTQGTKARSMPSRGGSAGSAIKQEHDMDPKKSDAPAAPVEAGKETGTINLQEALAADRKRCAAIDATIGGVLPDLAAKAKADGTSLESVKAQAFDGLLAKFNEQAKALDEAQAQTQQVRKLMADAGIKTPVKVDAVDEDTQAKAKDPASLYEQAVEDRKAELLAKGATQTKAAAQAYRDVARAHADWHAAWKNKAAK